MFISGSRFCCVFKLFIEELKEIRKYILIYREKLKIIMGMITRVRGRIRANSVAVDKEKIAQNTCLLNVILLLPFCSRGSSLFLQVSTPTLYTVLVLPIIISIKYKYFISIFRILNATIKVGVKNIWKSFGRFLKQLYNPINQAENLFLKMQNISLLLNQIVFLMFTEKLLLSEQKMIYLYTLIFYNVIAYCVSYIKELIEKEDWSFYITLTERSKIKHLAMSTTKIVLKWTKAVTFVVTMIFMLLVFGLEQGLDHYRPTVFYTCVTWIYYSATEKVFVEMFPKLLSYLQLEILENMEYLYAPVILKYFTISISALFSMALILIAPSKIIFIGIYLNVYLRYKELMQNSGATLKQERQILDQYRKATVDEIERFDDVCAVCLCNMSKARITPCHHLFHANCLRQCLKTSNNCPMCKRELKFD